jgi:hypothetical protein
MTAEGWRRGELAAMIALVAAGFALRLMYLDSADLWGDEAVSWFVSSGPLSGLGDRVATHDAKPPLYFVALNLWMRLFGDSEPSMRALSAMFWPPFALLMAAIGRRCCGRWSLLALALAALSPLLVYYGVEARPYAMLLCAEVWFALLVLKMLDSDATSIRIWLAVSSFCIVSLQFTGLFFIAPILGFYAFHRRRDRRELLRTLAPQAAASILFAGMLLAMSPGVFSRFGELESAWWAPRASIVWVISTPIQLLAPVPAWHFYTDWSKPLNVLLLIGAAGLAALWVVGLATSERKGFLFSATVGVMALFVAYSVTRANLLFPRYFIGCAPVVLIGVAVATERIWGRYRQGGRVLLPAVVSAQIVLLVALQRPGRLAAPGYPFERVPEYGNAVNAVLSESRGPVTILSAGWDWPSVQYYSRNAADRVTVTPRLAPGGVSHAAMEEIAGKTSAFYLVESFAWKDKSGRVEAELARLKAAPALVFEGGGVKVYRVMK